MFLPAISYAKPIAGVPKPLLPSNTIYLRKKESRGAYRKADKKSIKLRMNK